MEGEYHFFPLGKYFINGKKLLVGSLRIARFVLISTKKKEKRAKKNI